MIKGVLFDLDGTLLQMDEKAFMKIYFGNMAKKFEGKLDGELLIKGVMGGLDAMMKNPGDKKNEDVFWEVFDYVLGIDHKNYYDDFINYYENEFDYAQQACKTNPSARELVDLCKEKGLKVVLATNPVFPEIATVKRAQWANTPVELFEAVSTYENYHGCKPSVHYFEEILANTGLKKEEVIMIGNNPSEDGACTKLGIPFYFVTDCKLGEETSAECAFKGTLEEVKNHLAEAL